MTRVAKLVVVESSRLSGLPSLRDRNDSATGLRAALLEAGFITPSELVVLVAEEDFTRIEESLAMHKRDHEEATRAATTARAENTRLVQAVRNFLMMDDSPVWTLTERNDDGTDEVQHFCNECSCNEKTGEHEPECTTGVLFGLLAGSDKQTLPAVACASCHGSGVSSVPPPSES